MSGCMEIFLVDSMVMRRFMKQIATRENRKTIFTKKWEIIVLIISHFFVYNKDRKEGSRCVI